MRDDQFYPIMTCLCFLMYQSTDSNLAQIFFFCGLVISIVNWLGTLAFGGKDK